MGFNIKKSVKKYGVAAALGGVAGVTLKGSADKLLKGPDIPTPPGMSETEAALYRKNIELLDQERKGMDQNLALYDRASGYYNPDGTINEAAVGRLRGADDMAMARYERALRGDLPASVGLQQEEEEAFRLFRSQQARQGGGVQGNSFGTAIAGTTAGNQRLMGFGRNFALRGDEERRAELNSAPGRLGFASNLVGNRQNFTRGYAPLGGMYRDAAQPYTAQRELEYNGRLAKAGAKAGQKQALLGLAGTVAGAFIGGPAGAAAGGQVAQAAGGGGGGGGMGFVQQRPLYQPQPPRMANANRLNYGEEYY